MFIYIYDDRQSPQGDKYRPIVRAPGRYANPSSRAMGEKKGRTARWMMSNQDSRGPKKRREIPIKTLHLYTLLIFFFFFFFFSMGDIEIRRKKKKKKI